MRWPGESTATKWFVINPHMADVRTASPTDREGSCTEDAGPPGSSRRLGSLSSLWQNLKLDLASSSEGDLFSTTRFRGDDFVKSNGNFVVSYRNSKYGLVSFIQGLTQESKLQMTKGVWWKQNQSKKLWNSLGNMYAFTKWKYLIGCSKHKHYSCSSL